MASPSVRSSTTSLEDANNVTNHTVDLPATVSADDTIIIILSYDGSPDTTWPDASWDEIVDDNHSGGPNRLAAAGKKADGTEGGTTVEVATSSSERSTHVAYAIQDAADPDTSPPEGLVSQAGSPGINPNPPNLTPIGGSDDYLWIAGAGWDRDRSLVSYSSGYTSDQESSVGGGANSSGIAAATRTATASSEDPGTLEIGASDTYLAFTFAIYPSADNEDNLLADDVESASEVSAPVIGQEHALAADDVESASEVSAPVVGQEHALAADDVESGSEVSAPTLLEIHPLLADDVESASEVSSPALGQEHALTADDVESASNVSAPSVGQEHALLADDVESASEVSTPAASESNILNADDVESASEVSSPAVGQEHALLADDAESASEVGAPALGQEHALAADDVESGSEVSAPVFSQIHILTADDVESGSEVSAPTLAEVGIGAVINQFQRANLGADLFNGTLQ